MTSVLTYSPFDLDSLGGKGSEQGPWGGGGDRLGDFLYSITFDHLFYVKRETALGK
jgi:hypothetical protein